ncbi:outer membrane protein [Qipengyuania sp. ASV99]|uniref:outer membrane protein n=1 Tax=Qipengyuania sp. ASV99 TaxID=3399681 RepID=UPI003A4C5094
MNTRFGAILIAPLAIITLSSPAQAEQFEGPFVGAAAGYNRDEIGPQLGDGAALPDELTADAAYFQLFAGYDHAVAPKVRLGVEAAIGIGAEDELQLQDTSGSIKLDPEYSFEFTARAGYLVSDKALVYLRGGYQNSRVEATLIETGSPTVRDADNADGWLAGGGLEYGFGDAIRTRVEYRYSDLGSGGASWDRHQVLAGILYNF